MDKQILSRPRFSALSAFVVGAQLVASCRIDTAIGSRPAGTDPSTRREPADAPAAPAAPEASAGGDAPALSDAAIDRAADLAVTSTVDAGSRGEATAESGAPQASDSLPASCGYACEVDLVRNTHTCSGPVMMNGLAENRGFATVNLSQFAQMYLDFTVCEPQGWLLHIADSPTCDGYGADASSSSNDAEVNVIDRNVHFFANDFGGSVMMQNLPAYLEPTGCTTRTLWFADQKIESRGAGPLVRMSSPYLLRINPPEDNEGTPDALWYLGFNRVVLDREDRRGTGLARMAICLL